MASLMCKARPRVAGMQDPMGQSAAALGGSSVCVLVLLLVVVVWPEPAADGSNLDLMQMDPLAAAGGSLDP